MIGFEKSIVLELIPQKSLAGLVARLKGTLSLSPRAGKKDTIAVLDGVRAIAALSVVSLHLNKGAGVPWNISREPFSTSLAVFGRTGVVLFFVLSGFLLFRSYARALLFEERWPSLRTFYLRRIFRIWPAYYLTLALMIVFFERQYIEPAHWQELLLFLTFFMDSSSKTWQQLNGPFWTLAIEWQFYMVLPWIALAFAWVVKRCSSFPQQRLKLVLLCCGGLMVWGLVTRGLGNYWLNHPDWAPLVPRAVWNVFFFFTFGMQGKYLEVFALGMMVSTCYMYAQHPEFGRTLKARCERASSWIWGSGIAVLAGMVIWQAEATRSMNGVLAPLHAFAFLDPFQSYYPWLGDPISGIGYSTCILALLFGTPALRWFFETRLLGWIGAISFSLYMWHLKLLGVFQVTALPHIPYISVLFIYIIYWLWVAVVILPFCALFYLLVEKPGMRLGARLTAHRPEKARSKAATAPAAVTQGD